MTGHRGQLDAPQGGAQATSGGGGKTGELAYWGMDTKADVYRQIFATHPHATILFGLIDGRIEEVNEAALALYGYSREEMIGLPLAALAAAPEAILHKRKDGSMLAIEAHHSTVSVEGREVGVSVIRQIHPSVRTDG